MVEKLNRIKVTETLKNMGIAVFSPREFAGIFGIPYKTASIFIGRNTQSGFFKKLRSGFYMLADSHPSHFLIANKLYRPSYISLETALSHYGIIPETVYTITSVTTKPTREYTTPMGIFSYQRIKKPVFSGYGPVSLDGVMVLMATPEKALADYLYFVDLRHVSLNDRLSLRAVRKTQLIAHARLFARPGMLKLIQHIYVEQRKPRKIF